MFYGSDQENGAESIIKVKKHKLQSWSWDLGVSDLHLILPCTEAIVNTPLKTKKMERSSCGTITHIFKSHMRLTSKKIEKIGEKRKFKSTGCHRLYHFIV